ncbi:hypothetical protein NQ318_020336 [Aromia moschata]|uniref:Protein transport protein Sec24A n=1 Tax=Aromia moschata TaxID=1265417 RepID=A0AAV8XEW4_9CUCU|nr:hypothetical protein NQ318_020336 [Aromia moschata]
MEIEPLWCATDLEKINWLEGATFVRPLFKMYQPTPNIPEQSLPNGLPPNLDTSKQNIIPHDKAHYQFNGVHSAHSSRSSSPLVRLGHIPTSQLPPARSIPSSQLPPSRSPITTATQKMAGLSVGHSMQSVNPKFSTSTPNLQSPVSFGPNSAFSPISSAMPKPKSSTELEDTAVTNSRTADITKPQQTGNHQQAFPTNSIPNQQQPVPSGSLLTRPNQQQSVNLPSSSNQPFQHNLPQQQPQLRPVAQNVPQQQPFSNQFNPPQSMPGPQLPQQQRPPAQSQAPPVAIPPFPVRGHPTNHKLHSTKTIDRHITFQVCRVLTHPPQTVSSVQGFNGPVQNLQGMPMPATNQTGPPQATYQPQASPVNGQKANLHSNRYPVQQTGSPPSQPFPQQQQSGGPLPQQPYQQAAYSSQPQSQYLASQQAPYGPQQGYQNQYQGVTEAGFNKYWGTETIDLLQTPNVLPPRKVEAPRIYLGQEVLDQANCSTDIFRCTMTKIPENNSLLQKSRLPLGVLIHPFRDLSHLPVIQCNVIVRCRACRTYINPFVFFADSKRWKCNLCYRINELPEEFQYDPVSKTYGDPSRRPEIKASTIEYIAPAEYMLRPPQPAVYLYLMDVSRLAVESGYLHSVCNLLLEELKTLPGDTRTQIGFVTYDSALHFYGLAEGQSQPHEMTVLDIDDVFLPTPDNLLVNLKDRMELVMELLSQLPNRYNNSFDNNSALGAALQVAYKMMGPTGGRVTVFQASLPNVGPGGADGERGRLAEDYSGGDASQSRKRLLQKYYNTKCKSQLVFEHGRSIDATSPPFLTPSMTPRKVSLALECSGQQIAVDLFIVNSTYVDIATISGISRFSGGSVHHFPLYKSSKALSRDNFEKCLRRYLTRKIGFEAVMRIRCTRGLSIHTFHGNFFVRSTDLLSLPNINPDAGFGMQVAIEESLSDVKSVCFQAALLYTSSKGERRIRVHTVCLPIASTLHDVIHSADQQCIIGLLSKMAVDRSMQSSLSDAREAFINVAIDILSSYKITLNLGTSTSGLLAPSCLKLLPLYISALLKYAAFRTGPSTRLDDRVKAMVDMKTKPLYLLIQQIYPDMYPVHNLESQEVILNSEEEPVPLPPRLQLSARCLENKGAFLMDVGDQMIILVCPNVPQEFLMEALGVPSYDDISEQMYEIPVLSNLRNQRLHQFVNYLNEDKPYAASVQVIRDNSPNRVLFLERLIEDRVENALSYHEFLQHLKTQVK